MRCIIIRIQEDGEIGGAGSKVLFFRPGRGPPRFLSPAVSSFVEHYSEILWKWWRPCCTFIAATTAGIAAAASTAIIAQLAAFPRM